MSGDRSNSAIKALSKVPHQLMRNWTIELTSRCNLRCTYCSVPHSTTYGDYDMPKKRLDKLKMLMKDVKPSIVSLSGRGELTYIDGWQEIVEPFISSGMNTHTVTNLAKPLSWEEATTLSRFTSLTFSIDNVDRAITKEVRKGADLRNIIYNVNLIKAAAVNIGRDDMNFNVIAVVTRSSIGDFKRLASLMVALGTNNLILQDLVMDYSKQVNTVDIGHISTLNKEELLEAGKDIQAAAMILNKHKIGFSLHPSLLTILSASLGQGTEEVIVEETVQAEKVGEHKRHGCQLQDGQTRDCLHPWQLGIFLADGGVEPCCGSYGVTGNYEMASSVAEVFNSPDTVTLRQEILSGNLKKPCEFCGTAGAIDIGAFQKKVQKYITDNIQTPK